MLAGVLEAGSRGEVMHGCSRIVWCDECGCTIGLLEVYFLSLNQVIYVYIFPFLRPTLGDLYSQFHRRYITETFASLAANDCLVVASIDRIHRFLLA